MFGKIVGGCEVFKVGEGVMMPLPFTDTYHIQTFAFNRPLLTTYHLVVLVYPAYIVWFCLASVRVPLSVG